jgi:hypothetical protein
LRINSGEEVSELEVAEDKIKNLRGIIMDKKVEEEWDKILMAKNPLAGPQEIICSTTLLPPAEEDLFYSTKKWKIKTLQMKELIKYSSMAQKREEVLLNGKKSEANPCVRAVAGSPPELECKAHRALKF